MKIQDWIHAIEVGRKAPYVKIILFCSVVLFLGLVYDLRAYHNFNTQEAMDSAQLARNISAGKGYTTLCIRPFSLYLVETHNKATSGDAPENGKTDCAKIKTAHPDIANPPVYPLLLAGLMKVLPFHYPLNTSGLFWGNNGNFWRYEPDFLIALFNEMLLCAVVALTFFVARKMFDNTVAWISTILVAGCELLWRFSVSGLSTMLLMVIFLALTWCIVRIEEIARDGKPQFKQLLGLAIAAGAAVGIGVLTRYAFGWVIIPVTAFLILFSGPHRMLFASVALGTFLCILTPWIIRNFIVSGTPFGTAGFAMLEGTPAFPGFQLERSIHPDLSIEWNLSLYLHKLFSNTRAILQNTLPNLGGSWVSMLFLTGLLLSFRGVAVRRLRYFLLMCLAVFVVAQALGQTQLSAESPEVNSENLLVLLVPLVFIYGTSLFLILFAQMASPLQRLDYVVKGAFIGFCCLPMIFALLALRNPVVFPPYYPPDIQAIAGWMKPGELTMSDVPWAVAWYGQRQCVWVTLNTQDEFFAINDYLKPVQGLYLTKTMESELASDCAFPAQNLSWGSFAFKAVARNSVPKDFPLSRMPKGFLPSRLFLSDWDRWKDSGTINSPSYANSPNNGGVGLLDSDDQNFIPKGMRQSN